MTLTDLDRVLLGVTAALAAAVAWRTREHRPVAVWATGQAFVQLVARLAWKPALRAAIAAAGGDLDHGIRPPLPLEGWGRVVGIADVAAWLAWPAGFAALALWVFAEVPLAPGLAGLHTHDEWIAHEERWLKAKAIRGRFAAIHIVCWVAISAGIAATYPLHRDLYPRVEAGAQLAAVLVSLVALVRYGVRRWRGRGGVTATAVCVGAVVVVEAVTLVGSYRAGLYGETWGYDQVMTSVMYAFLILLQGGLLWTRR